MKHFLFRLIPPRPGFAQDMNAHEDHLMQEHAQSWHKLMADGKVVVFGLALL